MQGLSERSPLQKARIWSLSPQLVSNDKEMQTNEERDLRCPSEKLWNRRQPALLLRGSEKRGGFTTV